MAELHYGVTLHPQYTTWNDLKETAKTVERLGYDSVWTWDHFLPIMGDPTGPNFEGWQILSAWAALTERIQIGMLVTGNTYRHPAVVANMAATLDHISNGRAILGMGAAWYELEHKQYGIDFFASPGVRIARLGESLAIIRSMLDNRETTFEGKYYQVKDAMNEPKPLQKHLPIMIGGGGEQKTLRLVARYADMWNGFGPPDVIAHKLGILKGHCEEAGTDFNRIVTTVLLNVVIRDTQDEVNTRLQEVAANNKQPNSAAYGTVGGTPEVVARTMVEYWKTGVRGIILGGRAPYDTVTLERFQREVRPLVRELTAKETAAT